MGRQGKVCLVLGGGGVRGLAHLGVLQVLEREGIPIDCIVGTSVGAVVGAVYALEPDALAETRQALAYFQSPQFRGSAFKRLLLRAEDSEANILQSILSGIRKSYVLSNLLRKPSILPGAKLVLLVNDLVPDRDFEEVKVPFAVPALDLRTGKDVLLTEGSLRKAVLASCSLPGFFPPIEHGDLLLADAGVIGPVPVHAAQSRFEPQVVIAVDISSYLADPGRVDRGLDVLLRVESIACSRLNALEISCADVVIRPAVGGKYWSDFSDLESIVNAGVVAAEESLGVIRAAIDRKRKRRPFFWRAAFSPFAYAREG